MSIVKQTNNVKQSKTVEEIYKSMTPHEHVLKLPDMYVGCIHADDAKMWIYDEDKNKMVLKPIKYIGALYKIFDEILTNSRDQRVKDPTCTEIRVNISIDNNCKGIISIWNNGQDGIPVQIHAVEQCYVAEMLFSHLRTSSSYELEEKKTWGGRNGYGSKLTNIFSKKFDIEVIDSKLNLKYNQTFADNMYARHDPVITKLKGKNNSSTQITFIPDYERFGVDKLSDDMLSLFKKRVYDIAAITNVKVFLNGKLIEMSSFETYINMFYEDDDMPTPIYEQVNERWQVGIVYDQNAGYRQHSYTNGINTFQGGTHVNHVTDQITRALYDQIMSKNKTLKIKQSTIKDNLTFFINSTINDPSFSSQTKEMLTTKVGEFGSKCEISAIFIKKLSKTGIIEEVVNLAKFRALEDLKKTDGKKKTNLKGLAKLDDAHFAGTRKANQCTLILTEGDSAKSFATSGVELLGRDFYGVFPLKGKLLNVREATAKQLLENEEIKNIKQIMGLKHNKKYGSVNELRYGRILILADQDYDGSHIKGLLINFVHFFWPSLLKISGFIGTLLTPIIKAFKKTDTKKKNGIKFYTLTEYQTWKDSQGDKIKQYNIKYYKGLGTSTDDEAKEAFEDFEQKIIKYIWTTETPVEIEDIADIDTDQEKNPVSDDECDEDDKTNENYKAILLGFAKDQVTLRKRWLENYNRNIILENDVREVTYYDFIHKELIHFSNYDLERSMPSMCDGFKPSLRKILYASILRNIFKEEIKVSQLAGFISDKTGYHHGEASLQGAIIGMAQNFVGSNNINWLLPNGAFGNRRLGGDNHASARYIHTQLNELVPYVFRSEDECILKYVDDDGTLVEPEVYAPVICQLLVNASIGIGTGFSTNITQYNPKDVIKNQKLLIQNKEPVSMIPYFRGFKGKIIMINDKTFESHGIYEIIDENTIIIEELPVGTWTEKYKSFLDNLVADDVHKLIKGQMFKKIIDDCGNNTIKFTLIFLDGILQELVKKGEIEKRLQLVNKHSMTNMHAYNANGTIEKYNSTLDILKSYYKFRLEMYDKRKNYYLRILQNKLNVLEWKIKFIEYIIDGKIIIFEDKEAKSEEDVIQQLVTKGFPMLSVNIENNDKTYDYLTGIAILDLTTGKKNKLKNEYTKKVEELAIYKNISIQDMWLKELEEFEQMYDKWIINQTDDNNDKKQNKKGPKKGRKIVVKI